MIVTTSFNLPSGAVSYKDKLTKSRDNSRFTQNVLFLNKSKGDWEINTTFLQWMCRYSICYRECEIRQMIWIGKRHDAFTLKKELWKLSHRPGFSERSGERKKIKGHKTTQDVRVCYCLAAGATHRSHSFMNDVAVSQFTFLSQLCLLFLNLKNLLRFFRKYWGSGLQEGIFTVSAVLPHLPLDSTVNLWGSAQFDWKISKKETWDREEVEKSWEEEGITKLERRLKRK